MMKLFALLIISFVSFNATANDLFDIYKNSVSRQPYVEFLARSGVPGHAFIAIGEELDNGLLFTKGTFGFYPDKAKKLHSIKLLVSTDGIIDFKLSDLKHDLSFRVKVDDSQTSKVEKILRRWKKKSYSLFDNNCSKLASEVAKEIGLKLPRKSPGSTLPINYMKLLKKKNGL